MKILFISLLLIIVSPFIKSQTIADTTDPFFGHHSIGSSSEIFLNYVPRNSNQNRVIIDYKNNELEEKSRDQSQANGGGDYRAIDVVTGDFNGDDVDDVISAWQSTTDTWNDYYPLTLSIPQIDSSDLSWKSEQDTIIATDCGNQIRLIPGNFDYDDPKEFIIAYGTTNYTIRLILYELDHNYKLHEINRTTIDQISEVWDICADDLNGDGLDELLILNPYNIKFVSDDSCQLVSEVKIYKSSYDSGFELLCNNTIQTNNQNSLTYTTYNPYAVHQLAYMKNLPWYINCVGVTTGNVDDDEGKEVVYGYEISLPALLGLEFCAMKIYRMSYFDVPELSILQPIQTPRSDFLSVNKIFSNGDIEVGRFGHTIDIQTIDLDQDSKDEVFTFGDGSVTGHRLNPYEWFFTDIAWSKYDFLNSHNLLRVGDLDADPTDMNSLTPEVILFNIYEGQAALSLYKLNVDTVKHTIEENVDARRRILTGINADNLYSAAIAVGDFNGDGIHLGKPTILVKKSVFVPTIIINAPPSHFDILGDSKYDINFFYSPWSPSSPKPTTSTIYKETAEQTITCTSELKRDWQVSSEFKTGFKFIGVKYKAALKASYGEKLSRKNGTTRSITISKTAIADRDDFLFGMKLDYHLFEYPIMQKGKIYGNILFSTPVLKEEIGDYSKNLSFETYALKHEANNLLSYPYCLQINDNTDILAGEGNGTIFGTRYGLSDVLNPNDWKLDISKLKTANVTESNQFNIGMNVSASAWGCSIGLEGKYGSEGITSHETSLKEGFSMAANFDRINKGIGEVEYSLQPYVYWSENGALVIDYNVELNGLWWNDNYGTKPDLAFIMPYRYSPEKNQTLARESKRILTSDIRYFPYDAKPGDSITIMTTVRNFCLNNTVENATIDFYLGDPDENGKLIYSAVVENIKPRGSSTIKFNWKTPDQIPVNPWIFAVIDKDSLIKEIHKNNNKGFTFLFVNDRYPNYTTVNTEEPDNIDAFESSVFPNPTRGFARINYKMLSNHPIQFIIVNSLGQIVDQRINNQAVPGWNEEIFDFSSYPCGLYFYRLISDQSTITRKFIIE